MVSAAGCEAASRPHGRCKLCPSTSSAATSPMGPHWTHFARRRCSHRRPWHSTGRRSQRRTPQTRWQSISLLSSGQLTLEALEGASSQWNLAPPECRCAALSLINLHRSYQWLGLNCRANLEQPKPTLNMDHRRHVKQSDTSAQSAVTASLRRCDEAKVLQGATPCKPRTPQPPPIACAGPAVHRPATFEQAPQ